MQGESIELQLLAKPHDLAMKERRNFEVGIAATNLTGTTVDPELHLVRLLVNDQDFLAFGEAIGNGHRVAEWFALPPGERVSMTWRGMGEQLFPGPGAYTLKLTLQGRVSAPVVIHVHR